MYMTQRIINQSEAARIRGVSRQRISELYKKGRFTTPIDDKGNIVEGAVYRDEVVNMKEGKRGRPKLTDEERKQRGLDDFQIGQSVIWHFTPRDGHGFTVDVPATVEKLGASRLLIRFTGGDGIERTAWVNRDLCV